MCHTSSSMNLAPRPSGLSCGRPNKERLMELLLEMSSPIASLKKSYAIAAMLSSSVAN
jgi:hypothetical protein